MRTTKKTTNDALLANIATNALTAARDDFRQDQPVKQKEILARAKVYNAFISNAAKVQQP